MRPILKAYKEIDQSSAIDAPRARAALKLWWREQIKPLVVEHFWAFCEYVVRDEKSNEFIELQDFHIEWCDLFQKGQRLILFSPCDTGKSTLSSVAYPLWRLGLDPSLRVAVVSNTVSQASKFLSSIKHYIASSPEYQEVFPHIRPSPHPAIPKRNERWSDNAIILVRKNISKDPSVQALGVAGPLLSSRLDLLILDDVLDQKNTDSDTERTKIIRWHDSTARSRLDESSQEIIIGTAWSESPPDLMHYLEGKSEYSSARYSFDRADLKDGYHLVSWPEKFSQESLEKDKRHNPIEYNRQRRCRVTSKEDRVFADDFGPHVEEVELEGEFTRFMGVDLSTSIRKGTVIATIAVSPHMKVLEDIEYGAWGAEQKIEQIEAKALQFKPRIINIEENALQREFVELARAFSDESLPIQGYTTKSNKHALFSILSVEVKNGFWRFNSDHFDESCPCSFCTFLKELKYYPASVSQDGLMAWLFANEAARGLYELGEPQARIVSSEKDAVVGFDLSDYALYNRISESRGFQPPPGYEEIVRLLQFRGGLPEPTESLPLPYHDIVMVWEDMNYYLKMLNGRGHHG